MPADFGFSKIPRRITRLFNSFAKRHSHIRAGFVVQAVNLTLFLHIEEHGICRRKSTIAGYDYYAVQKRVNEILYKPKKSVDELARGVIHGDWGNGEERKKRLTSSFLL